MFKIFTGGFSRKIYIRTERHIHVSCKRSYTSNTYEYVLERQRDDADRVLVYAKELLSLGMLYFEFIDGIREGDGTRILRCWRYLMLVFKATNKTKYAIQAATLLFQYHYQFTDRMKEQLIWSRTINTSGRMGRNIPMDLHMEHLNRDLKSAIGHLSSNVNEVTIDRIGKSLRKLGMVKENFDYSSEITLDSGYHSTPPLSKDLKKVLDELRKKCVYKRILHRKHSQFPRMKGNVVGVIQKDKLSSWLKAYYQKLLRTI